MVKMVASSEPKSRCRRLKVSSADIFRYEDDWISAKEAWWIDGGVRVDGDDDDDDGCHVLEGAIGDERRARSKMPPMFSESRLKTRQ